ncbi:hypothetical protein Ddye_024562 [Dipteronia dyeriana]|uniref:Uncharacterized protein n=1 Tax=Dipteronia dyeriana TaxID=168575 RepID=A0AAD9TW05_9ROSI|nr:hypothetical protein Ddye_024562 [Dipteronia dyeriana]
MIKRGTRAMCNFCKKDYAATPSKNVLLKGKRFRELTRNACPGFDIPSRRTVTRNVLQLYADEKATLKSLFSAKKFKPCAELEKIVCGRVVVMDAPIRWNSTCLMLETALIFQKAFENIEDDDELYNSYSMRVKVEGKGKDHLIWYIGIKQRSL